MEGYMERTLGQFPTPHRKGLEVVTIIIWEKTGQTEKTMAFLGLRELSLPKAVSPKCRKCKFELSQDMPS